MLDIFDRNMILVCQSINEFKSNIMPGIIIFSFGVSKSCYDKHFPLSIPDQNCQILLLKDLNIIPDLYKLRKHLRKKDLIAVQLLFIYAKIFVNSLRYSLYHLPLIVCIHHVFIIRSIGHIAHFQNCHRNSTPIDARHGI